MTDKGNITISAPQAQAVAVVAPGALAELQGPDWPQLLSQVNTESLMERAQRRAGLRPDEVFEDTEDEEKQLDDFDARQAEWEARMNAALRSNIITHEMRAGLPRHIAASLRELCEYAKINKNIDHSLARLVAS